MNNQSRPGKPGVDPREVLTRPARAPDLVLSYGDEADQAADVHLPRLTSATGAPAHVSAPLILFLHGGFWRAEYGREHTAPLAEALARDGFAVCAPEYRRTGQPGGGWPGTFDDVAAAVDRLPGLVAEATGGLVDAGRVVLAGHSAGGHLALWAASRQRLPVGSRWHASGSAGGRVVALAPVSDLVACYERALGQQAAGALMGGGPDELADRYGEADPSQLLPAGARARLVHGTADDRVPCEMSLSYVRRARSVGDDAGCLLLPGAGHFDVIDPLSWCWPRVAAAFRVERESAG
jgi:acetyl esterase/lipase